MYVFMDIIKYGNSKVLKWNKKGFKKDFDF
jgi:hypothetical protein